MTGLTQALDQLAPVDGWEDDWADVLRRAGEEGGLSGVSRRVRQRPRRSRRVVLLAAAVAAVVAPLTALAAINHWWFLGAGSGLPRPGQRPTVAHRGSWLGHRWALVAYPSKHFAGTTQVNGLCWGLSFSGHTRNGGGMYGGVPHGADDGVGCGSLVGIQKPRLVADLAEEGDPVPTVTTEMRYPSGEGYLPWISGVVVSSATKVVIRWPARTAIPGRLASPRVVARAATFPAPVAGYRVRLFAIPLPKPLLRRTRTASVSIVPSEITGTNRHDRVVACGWPGGYLPLSSCRP
jgi:hypothetical protein